MDEIFGELLKLPCWYCEYYYGCGKKQERVKEDFKFSVCEQMELDCDIVLDGCKAYFDCIKTVKKNEKRS